MVLFISNFIYSSLKLGIGAMSGWLHMPDSSFITPKYKFELIYSSKYSSSNYYFSYYIISDGNSGFYESDVSYKWCIKRYDLIDISLKTNFIYSSVFRAGKIPDEVKAYVDSKDYRSRFLTSLEMFFDYEYFDGVFDLAFYWYGDKVAPNLVPIKPFFHILSISRYGVSKKRRIYMFTNFEFLFERKYDEFFPVNMHDGIAMTKREFNFVLGVLWSVGKLELELYTYAFNNLNRGLGIKDPWGFKDGFGISIRRLL
ncbi:MAG: hypothetical protein NZ870_00535 [bacterium]|nr:hypothetical protein [bacterium]